MAIPRTERLAFIAAHEVHDLASMAEIIRAAKARGESGVARKIVTARDALQRDYDEEREWHDGAGLSVEREGSV